MSHRGKSTKRQRQRARQAQAAKVASRRSAVLTPDAPTHSGGKPAQAGPDKAMPERGHLPADPRQEPEARKTASPDSAPRTEPEEEDDDSVFERVMEQAAQPGWLVTWALVPFVLLAGWVWPKYVVDPTAIGGRLHDVMAGVIAVLLFLSFSTLTLLAYSLLAGGPSETNKKFLSPLLNRAAIGATLGALLGVRLAPVLLNRSSDIGVGFPGYLSDVGDTVTFLTLVLIATLWPHALGTLMRTLTGAAGSGAASSSLRLKRQAVMIVVVAVNYLGGRLAFEVYEELARH